MYRMPAVALSFGTGAWHALVTEMKSVLIGISDQPAGTACQYVPHCCT
jgi:hypothetical protein